MLEKPSADPNTQKRKPVNLKMTQWRTFCLKEQKEKSMQKTNRALEITHPKHISDETRGKPRGTTQS